MIPSAQDVVQATLPLHNYIIHICLYVVQTLFLELDHSVSQPFNCKKKTKLMTIGYVPTDITIRVNNDPVPSHTENETCEVIGMGGVERNITSMEMWFWRRMKIISWWKKMTYTIILQ